jgi:hypothetical protein
LTDNQDFRERSKVAICSQASQTIIKLLAGKVSEDGDGSPDNPGSVGVINPYGRFAANSIAVLGFSKTPA